jgi:glycosyltransferase involved in cell wall biosynthesis
VVSVIIPTFRRAHMVERALDSVRSQSYKPIEVLVIDDGSDDGTAATVQQWAKTHGHDDFRVRFLEQEHRGAPRARNTGLAHCTGEFIQYLDSDDTLCPDKFIKEVAALRASGLRYAWSSFSYSTGTSPGSACVAGDAEPRVVSGAAVPSRVVGLYRRSLCVDVGPWDERLRRFQDWEYNARVAGTESRVVSCSGTGYVIVAHSGERIDNISRDENYEAVSAVCEVAIARCDTMAHKGVFRDRIARAYVNSALMELRSGNGARFVTACSCAIPLASRQRRMKLAGMRFLAAVLGVRATRRVVALLYPG